MGNPKYWELADRYLEEFIYPKHKFIQRLKLKWKYRKYKKNCCFTEFFYAYDEFYVVCDLMEWSYEELMDWVEENIDRINELYEEVHGPEFKNVYKCNKDYYYDKLAKDIQKRSK